MNNANGPSNLHSPFSAPGLDVKVDVEFDAVSVVLAEREVVVVGTTVMDNGDDSSIWTVEVSGVETEEADGAAY